MAQPLRVRGLLTAFAFVLFVGWLGVYLLSYHPKETWTRSTTIGGMGAEVRIVYQPRPKFMLGPLRMWAWGEDRYKTTAKLDNGEEIRFAVEKEPRAIWRLQGAYYVACYSVGRDWLIARIDGPGKLTPISRGQLPQGELDWNLEPAEYRAEWRERFDREVK